MLLNTLVEFTSLSCNLPFQDVSLHLVCLYATQPIFQFYVLRLYVIISYAGMLMIVDGSWHFKDVCHYLAEIFLALCSSFPICIASDGLFFPPFIHAILFITTSAVCMLPILIFELSLWHIALSWVY